MNENNQPHHHTVPQNTSRRTRPDTAYIPSSTTRQQTAMPPLPAKRTPPPIKSAARMPKARALALVSIFKRWIVLTSLVGFLSLSGLAALHRTSTATTSSSTHIASATTTSKKVATVKATATATPKITAKATSKKKTIVEATPTQKGYGFGASTPTPTPVTTSSVS